MTPLRVGLIGCGWYGKVDLLRLLQVEPVEVVSLCDVDSKMLNEAADIVAGQLRQVAGSLLEASPADIELAGGAARVRGDDTAAIGIPELARVVHFQAHRLAEDLRYALEARATFDPPGTFSNACHAAMVVIDPGTCAIRLHRYLVVEDCGVIINPVVVDGQVRGGVTQVVAAALLERVCFDAEGQPVALGPRPDRVDPARVLGPDGDVRLEFALEFHGSALSTPRRTRFTRRSRTTPRRSRSRKS